MKYLCRAEFPNIYFRKIELIRSHLIKKKTLRPGTKLSIHATILHCS
jgi:hypothetical protein